MIDLEYIITRLLIDGDAILHLALKKIYLAGIVEVMGINFPLTIKIMYDKRSSDAPFVAYSPELDVASCGKTEEKARQNLHEVVEIFLEEAKKKGKLDDFLKDQGFEKRKDDWQPPRVSFEPFFFSAAI